MVDKGSGNNGKGIPPMNADQPPSPRNGLGAVTFVIVVLGALLAVIPAAAAFGALLCFVAIIPAIVAFRRVRKGTATNRRCSVAALVLAPVFFIVATSIGVATAPPLTTSSHTETAAASPAPSAAPLPATALSPTPAPIAAAPSTPVRSAQPDWIKICKIDDGNGTYYLNISSATAHNFTACGTPPALYSGTIDDLLRLPGMDRRCMSGNADVAQEQADIGVYSDTKQADLAAAKAFCSVKSWSNE